jgi:hypothetical protein
MTKSPADAAHGTSDGNGSLAVLPARSIMRPMLIGRTAGHTLDKHVGPLNRFSLFLPSQVTFVFRSTRWDLR